MLQHARMKRLTAFHILLSAIFCPLFVTNDVVFGHYVVTKQEHKYLSDPPCAVCPRKGVCVPKIQCPGHIRPGAYNPRCHIDKHHIGVCCSNNNAEDSETIRLVNNEDIKAVHNISKQRLDSWLKRAELLARNNIGKNQEPTYHYMPTNKATDELGHGGLLNVFAAQELRTRQATSDEDLALAFTRSIKSPFCPLPPTCAAVASKYRRIDGNCNNIQQPSWGAALTGYERILPPDYRDGVWALRLSATGSPLPSARDVSDSLLVEGSHPSRSHNLLFMQFGHFLAHDVSAGVLFTTANGTALSCCSADGNHLPIEQQHWACQGIDVSPKDTFYGQFNKRCMNFVRTQLAPPPDCAIGYAKQMNGATHYIDLSPLYGSSLEKAQELRVGGGLLKSFHDFGRTLPPLTNRKECLIEKHGAACFNSGDSRVNQIISLTVMHTLFLREHNRIARALSLINPEWDSERVFNEARRIVQAEFQNIVYNEWLPLLLGTKIMRLFEISTPKGYSSGYNPGINPSTTAEFASAAMRFGHSIVDGNIMVPQSSDVVESIPISEVMHQPSRMRLKPFLDRMLTGMSWQPMQNVDPIISHSLSQYLFHGGHPYGLDLAAINIQRGRDYGLPAYNYYRRLIGLEPLEFTQYSLNVAKRLALVYHSPYDIDLWIGGLLEKPIDGGLVGPTFAQILADQFTRFKRGDRYFFDYGPDVNPGAFKIGQLLEIKKVTFARIICDNSDHIELKNQSPDAFLRADLPGNEPVPCDSPLIPTVNLKIFKDSM